MSDSLPATGQIPSLPSNYELRIPPNDFVAFLFAFILFVIIPAGLRIFFRVYYHRRLYLDDWLLIFAVACLSPAAALAHKQQDTVQLQLDVSTGRKDVPSDFASQIVDFEKSLQIASALVWSALYAIKLSFLVFFHQFTRATHRLHIYWWTVVVLCILCAGVSIPLGFFVCAHYDPNDFFEVCPVSTQLAHERVYLVVTTTMDVVTDVGVIIIPALLLIPLKLPMLRKLAVWGMMSLSTFMVVIAIVRAAGASLPNEVIDISWLAFWQGMESAVAVLMASLLVLEAMLRSSWRSHKRPHLDAEKGALEISSPKKQSYSLDDYSNFRSGHRSISEPQPVLQDRRWDYTDTFAPPPVPPKYAAADVHQLRPHMPESRPSDAGSIPMLLIVPESSTAGSMVSPPWSQSKRPESRISEPSSAKALLTSPSPVLSPVSPLTPHVKRKTKPAPLSIPPSEGLRAAGISAQENRR